MESEDNNIVRNVVSRELEASSEQNNEPSSSKRRASSRTPVRSKRKRQSGSNSLDSSESETEDKQSETSDEEWSDPLELDETSEEDSDPAWGPDNNLSQRRNSEARVPAKQGRKPKTHSNGNAAPAVNPQPQPNSQAAAAKAANVENRDAELNSADYMWHFCGYSEGIDSKSYTSTTFIMLKSDLKTQPRPTLWRVDGKSLLQKFDPMTWEGKSAYRSVSTYTSWNPANRGLYVPVQVQYHLHAKAETVVSLYSEPILLPLESSVSKKMSAEEKTLTEDMDVYIQTLVSQALDPDFLSEIYRERDEYFLASIQKIEAGVVRPRLNGVTQEVALLPELQNALETFPNFQLTATIAPEKVCRMCGTKNPTRQIAFAGPAYNRENLQQRVATMNPPTWVLCYACTDKALIFHQLCHFRFRVFQEVQKKTEDRERCNEANMAEILKAILADQQWMDKMKGVMIGYLAEAEQFIQHGHA